MPTKRAFLSLGSNLGNRTQNLADALRALQENYVRIAKCSAIYETEPQDIKEQPWFFNIAVAVQTTLSADELLVTAQRIEREQGRTRAGVARRGPRTIDIDILLYENLVLSTERLSLPHPRLRERRFVLEPLLEIAPDVRDPVNNEPIQSYLSNVTGQSVVKLHKLWPVHGA